MRALLIAFLLLTTLQAQAQNQCAAAAQWTAPGSGRVEANEVLSRAARAQAVLLGESHENADHHRWQLQTMAALLALQPKMLIGFEMFPRRLQGVLDSWVAGEFGEQEFLRASEWNQVWGFDPALYLPLFHFARLNRIRMLALNVDNSLVRTVSLKGIAAIPLDKRENVSDPAPATEAYLNWLFPIYAEHRKGESSRNAPEFQLFVESQLLWDRALAQRLAEAAKAQPGTLVIGVMGSGHLLHGHGVPRQLKDLGIERVDKLLPWTPNQQCKDLTAAQPRRSLAFRNQGLQPHARCWASPWKPLPTVCALRPLVATASPRLPA